MRDMKNFLISIIIPVYNEEDNIKHLLEKILPILKPYKYELIFVDDGSKDKTNELIRKHIAGKNQLKLITFNRNFGHQMALTAGYSHAQGDCVITMDADLQDPPELIPQMIEKWQDGFKIVYARREKREVDNFFKKITANLFYRFINSLSETPIPEQVGDYRLVDRIVVDFIVELPEHSRFLRGLVAWGGYPTSYVDFQREKRFAGETHYTISKMIAFAIDGITSFSTKPLHIATYVGFMVASLGFIGIIYAVLGRIFLPSYWVTGWTALFVGIMFIGGVQLITIGIIGEYISKIYKEVQNRPRFVIKEKTNI
jgi:polyisoprenyl-phosphate glycosyltransferase